MADDLDALFGAFDGDGEAYTGKSPPEEKKKSEDDVEDKSKEAATNDKTPKDSDVNATTTSSSKPKTAASTYTSVMSKPLASHLRDDTATISQDRVALAKKTALANAGLVKEEIATGTSHDKSVRSYSAYPKNLPPELEQLQKEKAAATKPKEPAKTYPFPLDPFQAQAIGYIDKEESVLVAAHTSAGKTVAAEYAIAKSLKAGQVRSTRLGFDLIIVLAWLLYLSIYIYIYA